MDIVHANVVEARDFTHRLLRRLLKDGHPRIIISIHTRMKEKEDPHPWDFEDKSRLTKEDTQFIAKEAAGGAVKSLLLVPVIYIAYKLVAFVFSFIWPS